jgi:hypothetical protein
MLVGCGMPKFGEKAWEHQRETCQRYVDSAAPFIGQQQGLGVSFAILAVLAVSISAAMDNASAGNFLEKNRKAILMSCAAACAILCYNFLGNAKSAADSASQASVALASTSVAEMWAGCQHARAVYFDGRSAGISSTRDAIKHDIGSPSDAPSVAPVKTPAEPVAPPSNAASATRSPNRPNQVAKSDGGIAQ